MYEEASSSLGGGGGPFEHVAVCCESIVEVGQYCCMYMYIVVQTTYSAVQVFAPPHVLACVNRIFSSNYVMMDNARMLNQICDCQPRL